MSIYGDEWDRKTRSVAVEQGYSCTFYTERACPPGAGHITMGRVEGRTGIAKLPPGMDLAIRSVFCSRM